MNIDDYIPKTLNEWDINVINNLIKFKDIEGEEFDFKLDVGSIEEDICAMANSRGGYIVLGIKDLKDKHGNIIRFEKKGYKGGKEDAVKQSISNKLFQVEPIPEHSFDLVNGSEQSSKNLFFPVIKIPVANNQKPYFVKGRNLCYIRIGNTSQPCGRTIILNLASNYVERKNSVLRLKAASRDLIEQIHYTSADIERTNPESDFSFIKPLNLYFLQNAVLDTDWLFMENNLLGGHIDKNTEIGGYYMFHDKLERLNLAINSYNQPINPFNRQYFLDNKKLLKESQLGLRFWHPGGQKSEESIAFLKDLIGRCDKFDEKTK